MGVPQKRGSRRTRLNLPDRRLRRGANAARASIRDIAALVGARARVDPGRAWDARALVSGVAGGERLARVAGRCVEENDGRLEMVAIRRCGVARQAGPAREAVRRVAARVRPATAAARATAATARATASATRATRAASTVAAGAARARSRTAGTASSAAAAGAAPAAGAPAAARRPVRATDGRVVAVRGCVDAAECRERRAPAVIRAKRERDEPHPRCSSGLHSIFLAQYDARARGP